MNIIAILFVVIGFICCTAGTYFSIVFLGIGVIFLGIGTRLLIKYSTENYVWKCPNCGNEFKITLKENMSGLNCGINEKELK